jgi:DNA-binding MarR family transcriptional regulator
VRPGPLPSLSSAQRLLLWLAQAQGGSGGGRGATQGAIAAALAISRSQASRVAGGLVRGGLAAEEPLRLAGFGRTLTSYALTPKGEAEAARLATDLGALPVPVVRAGGPATVPLGEAVRSSTPPLGLLEALERLGSVGRLDLDAADTAAISLDAVPDRAPAGRYQRDLLEAPPPRPFAGRAAELREVGRWLASRGPILVTEAPAGQGKSSLAAHALRTAAIPRHVLWVQVTESLRADAFVARLDRWLRALGRPGPALSADDEGALVRALRERIGRLPVLVVADDVQKATPPLRSALWALARAAAAAGNPRLWLLGREAAVPHDLLPEAERRVLPPLPDAEADEMLQGLGVAAADRPSLVHRCSGNPLFLALAARSPQAPQKGADLAHYLLRELVPTLSPEERLVLEGMCALRLPARREVLARLDLDRAPVLARLQQVHLLAEDGSQRLAVQDLVRETLYGALPPGRRREVHAWLAESYRPRGDDWGDVGEFLHHLAQAGRREEAVRWLLRHRSRFLEEAAAIAGQA